MVKYSQYGRVLFTRQRVFWGAALLSVAIAISLCVYFILFYNSQTVNPIVGKWRSAEPYFGKTEYLNFSKRGVIQDGSLIHTTYKIHRNTIYVETNLGEQKYVISNDRMRLFIRKPRVGKLTFNRVGPLPKELQRD
ncbi:DUF2850 domain-containing protein [Celerinatantimonas diazotrophica]|uniref:Uncharacterized protein DUF2850 n=1 Tax=Celerinatantimonas diazotrophica TaxID=412034 RepID=A0A4R1KI46_9GAMM|nr:DUF2850 domain-containing protein [Celerinatantimonas diazotrophica]TCK63927.1 uncharacterized protein DUF2850 [Celerinatantimonas diazotrophica]CAG9297012.1 hypothetical protein CEDIAZO_02174 [Celerinatantimonas diazotrophica]